MDYLEMLKSLEVELISTADEGRKQFLIPIIEQLKDRVARDYSLSSYHKEELQFLLIAVMGSFAGANGTNEARIYKAWIDRIRYALKDK